MKASPKAFATIVNEVLGDMPDVSIRQRIEHNYWDDRRSTVVTVVLNPVPQYRIIIVYDARGTTVRFLANALPPSWMTFSPAELSKVATVAELAAKILERAEALTR